jgi:hypothetical protein
MDHGPGRQPDEVRIESIDLENDEERVRLGCEIAALANSGGGRILVGIEAEAAGGWNLAELEELADRLLAPDRLALALNLAPVELPPGRAVAEIDVPRCDNPPLVVIDAGPHGHHAVLVRRNGRVEAARRADHLRWRHELRQRLLQQFQMVVEAPESSRLRVVGDDEVRDEPNFMLSRAVDLFRQRREKLLDGDDLIYLFRHRHTIDFTAAGGLVAELLVHSALRRRSTLFFWLALTKLDAHRVRSLIHEALGGADRDKSDMGTVVPLVAALYLDEVSYAGVIDLMARSRYAHLASAAKDHPTLASAQGAVEERRRGGIDGRPLARLGDDELLSQADELATGETSARASRRMPNLGLEYLARRLA